MCRDHHDYLIRAERGSWNDLKSAVFSPDADNSAKLGARPSKTFFLPDRDDDGIVGKKCSYFDHDFDNATRSNNKQNKQTDK